MLSKMPTRSFSSNIPYLTGDFPWPGPRSCACRHVECHAKRGEGAPQDPTTRIVSVPLEEEKEEGPIENANVVR